jgi:hypothetical protein
VHFIERRKFIKLIINEFKKEIDNKNKSLDAIKNFSSCAGCSVTSSGWDRYFDIEDTVRWLQSELAKTEQLPQCNCSKYLRFFKFNKQLKAYRLDYKICYLYQCRRCKKYYSVK